MFKQKSSWILASSSPRRSEMFQRYKFDFRILSPDVDETPLYGENPKKYVLRMAKIKADFAYNKVKSSYPIIAADTIIDHNGKIVGKPKDWLGSVRILSSLNGQKHKVHTATYVYVPDKKPFFFTTTTIVEFFNLPLDVIKNYAKSLEGLDKSGSYSIDGLGTLLIKKINGSFNSVIGFAIEKFINMALKHNLIAVE